MYMYMYMYFVSLHIYIDDRLPLPFLGSVAAIAMLLYQVWYMRIEYIEYTCI